MTAVISQPGLFDAPTAPGSFPPCDPCVPEESLPRLSRQCREILERLRRGRASNDELSKISRKYTSRISDIRKADFDVRCMDLDHKTGLAWYALFETGLEVPGA
ncbi:MAG: hypothetical protein KGL39_10570 [Patescibacteria group bacterium]|nr:hypothetical protein [Patescibacteria group bacterium]